MLNQLLTYVLEALAEDKCVEEIIIQKNIVLFKENNIISNTDQEISDFLEEKSYDKEKKDKIFEVFQKIKIEQSIDNMQVLSDSDEKQNQKIKLHEMFASILAPEEISVSDDEVLLKYRFGEGSTLMQLIEEKEKWSKDNIIETISEKYGMDIGDVAVVGSVAEYIEVISEYDQNNYVSRGQKDCKFKLEPSLHRLHDNGYSKHSNKYESDFKQRLLYYDNKSYGKNNEEIRAYGQHFGLPTNYLDFTESHLTSLLFAVEEYDYQVNHSIVFFVDAAAHNRETIGQEKKLVDFSDENIKKAVLREYGDESFFIKVGNSNERIHFQKGCFLKVEPTSLLHNMYKKHTKIIIIDKDKKKEILKELFVLGITFENIYPDKDNMVKTIKFTYENL